MVIIKENFHICVDNKIIVIVIIMLSHKSTVKMDIFTAGIYSKCE